jgi:hypothetical protein
MMAHAAGRFKDVQAAPRLAAREVCIAFFIQNI